MWYFQLTYTKPGFTVYGSVSKVTLTAVLASSSETALNKKQIVLKHLVVTGSYDYQKIMDPDRYFFFSQSTTVIYTGTTGTNLCMLLLLKISLKNVGTCVFINQEKLNYS